MLSTRIGLQSIGFIPGFEKNETFEISAHTKYLRNSILNEVFRGYFSRKKQYCHINSYMNIDL